MSSQRLNNEIHELEALKKSSSIFDFKQHENERKLTVIFNGKGIQFVDSDIEQLDPKSEIKPAHAHQISIVLPDDFPVQPPEVRWLTPIIHPNVSFSGIVDLAEIGIVWQEKMSLSILCERLWNMTRLGYSNLDDASNQIAKEWMENECSLRLPVDRRTLRNRSTASPQNIISYKRKASDSKRMVIDEESEPAKGVLYIGEESEEASSVDGLQFRSNLGSAGQQPIEVRPEDVRTAIPVKDLSESSFHKAVDIAEPTPKDHDETENSKSQSDPSASQIPLPTPYRQVQNQSAAVGLNVKSDGREDTDEDEIQFIN